MGEKRGGGRGWIPAARRGRGRAGLWGASVRVDRPETAQRSQARPHRVAGGKQNFPRGPSPISDLWDA